MKNTIKRIVSFLLAVVMVLGMVPAGVIHMPHAHAATDPSKYDLVIDFDYQTENNVKTPEQALELVKDESLSDMSQPTLSRSVYDGDWDELREWLEDPSDSTQIIQLQEDVTIYFNASRDDYDGTFKITGDKILDLNGYEFQIYDGRNAKQSLIHWAGNPNGDQNTTISSHHAYIFQISQGATLTVIDSGGTKDDPGRIYHNACMINHQVWDFLYYTHRDIFHVLDGNVVIYGGEFQAGRQKDQLKSNFSWTKLKNVIGQAVVLGTNILEYTSGISAAEAADLDLKEELFLSKDNKDTEGDDDGKGDKGATDKKTGESGTEDTKKDTPASAGAQGDKSQQAEQTVAQKQNGKNNGTQDGASKGDQSGKNESSKDKPAKEEGKWTQLAKSEKAIASAMWDKDKIGNMVNSAFDLVEGIAGLFGDDERSRATACIQGTVAKVSNGGTLVIYDGYFIGHGSTPNVRNAVIEVETSNVKNTNPQSLHYGKNTGGYVYVYGGTFDAMTGANVFNMVVTKTNQKQFTYTMDSSGNIVATEVTLPKHETQNMQVLRYDPASLDEWQAGYDAIDASDTAALEAYPNPEMVNTANVVVRGGTFRCYYEPIIMSVLENKKEGSWCPDCQKYDDDCDGIDHHIFNGTAGAVNLGVASFDQDLIKDGRIQIVDVYGQGKLVLLDGGEPIYSDGEPASGNNDSYQTEGGFRQYRLFCGDTELRVSSYLMVYPNDAKTNSSNSMALRTYWGTGDDLSDMWDSATPKEEKEWPADMDNIRAPYSSNEKYIEFVYDDNEDDGDGISANYYVIPNLKNTDPMGSNLNSSNVWYYNVPVDADEEPIESKVRYFDYDNYTLSGYVTKDVEYATNIKWFNYKVYRVDPLSRENISENGIPCENDDNPLIEVCYGASPDSLKCKLPLLYLEEQIKARVPGWDGYDSGEMYRIVFSVEEHLAYGFQTEAEFDGEMTPASAESSILFLCVSKDELKKETYTNPNTGKEATHYVPDWTPLHFTTDEVMAGETATVSLIEGQTGLVDWVGDKVFDVYYQWWEVDENGNDIRLLAGTDNIWVAQDTVGKNNHRPSNWIIDEDGNGINGELYANTVDPDSAAATAYEYFPNGLPKNTENPQKSGALWSHEMLHMYTLETTGQNEGLKARPNESLNMGNNNAFWGNTDSCYIPDDMAGKYLQVRVIAVNCQYPTYYDNKQTYKSHVMFIDGPIVDFEDMIPGVSSEEDMRNFAQLGSIDEIPKFSFTYEALKQEDIADGFTVNAKIIHKLNGEVYAETTNTNKYVRKVSYQPTGIGSHEVIFLLEILKDGEYYSERKFVYQFTTVLDLRAMQFTGFGPMELSEEQWENREADIGVITSDQQLYVTYERPEWAIDSNYTWVNEIYLDDYPVYSGNTNLETTTDPETGIVQYTLRYPFETCGKHTVVFKMFAYDENRNLVTKDSMTVYCYVTPDEATGLTLLQDSSFINMDFGRILPLPVIVEPVTAVQQMIYTSSNPDVVYVDEEGYLQPNHSGSAVIMVEDINQKFHQQISVTVPHSTEHAPVYVGGVALMPGEYLETGSTVPTTTQPDDNYAYLYEDSSGVWNLKLVNYDYQGHGYLVEDAISDMDCVGYGIYYVGTLKIELEGENTFNMKHKMEYAGNQYEEYLMHGIYVGSDVVISGDGSLNLEYVTNAMHFEGAVTFDGGTVNVDNCVGYGLYHPIPTNVVKTIWFTHDAVVNIRSTQEAILGAISHLNFNGCNVRLVSTEESAVMVDSSRIILSTNSNVWVEGLCGIVSGSGLYFQVSGNLLVRSTADWGDDSFSAIQATNFSGSLGTYMASTEASGVNYTTVSTMTNVGDYDFICAATTPTVFGVQIGDVLLFDGTMLKQGESTVVEAQENVSGTISFVDGVVTIHDFTSSGELTMLNDVTVNLIGTNELDSVQLGDNDVEFIGSGSLYIIGANDTKAVEGGHFLTFSGTGTVSAGIAMPEYGFYEPLRFTVNSGNVIGRGATAGLYGVNLTQPYRMLTDIVINGGMLELYSNYSAATSYVLVDEEYMDVYLSDDDMTMILTCHTHSLTYVPAIEGDCLNYGREAYYVCSCGRYFKNADKTGEFYDLATLRTSKSAHKWQEANCQAPQTCTICGATTGTIGGHGWEAATCTEPESCSYCGLTQGEELGHIMDFGTVTKAPTCCEDGVLTYTCSVCGGTETEAIPADPNLHKFDIAATCDEAIKCSLCGDYSGYALGHQWEDATCTAPKTCSVCHATEGSALGHNWADATCTTPKRCASCGITDGSALGHNWIDATCTEPKTCDRCMLTDGAPLEHTWDVSDCTQARTCTGCGETAEAGVHTLTTDDLRHQGTCEVCGMTIASELHTFGDDDFCDVCGKEVILISDVYLYFEAPVGGNAPDYEIEVGDPELYTSNYFKWRYSAGASDLLPDGYVYECGGRYYAMCGLQPAAGYRFESGKTNFHHNGNIHNSVMLSGTTYYVQLNYLSAAPHGSITHVPAVEATCTTAGNVEYYHCDTCNKNYTTETGNTEITDVVTPALGHNMVDGTCTRCGYSEAVGGPQIVSQPVDYVGMVGDNATFTVVAEGEGLTYEWYFSTDHGASWAKTGETSNVQTITFKAFRLNMQVRCVITDANGNTVTSNSAAILAENIPLAITKQPENYIGAAGDDVTFALEATGNGLVYEWFVSNDEGATWVKAYMTGYDTDTLTTALRPFRDGYVFYCKVSDVFGNTAQSDVVSMIVKSSDVVITSQPASVTDATILQWYTFKVVAEGENLTYLWEVSDDNGVTWQQSWNEGYDTNTLNIRMYAYRDGYQYRCRVTSGLKTVVVTDVVRFELQDPSVAITVHPVNDYVLTSQTATMHIEATGTDLTYQWYWSKDNGETWEKCYITGYDTDTMSFVAIPSRVAMFRCEVTDGSGTSVLTNAAYMKILSAELSITSQPQDYVGEIGDTASFTIAAAGDTVHYRWYVSTNGGASWTECWFDGYDTATLSVALNASRMNLVYRCVVSDIAGNTLTSNTVGVVSE